eukprot:Opistho-1_new@12603
MPAGSRRRAPDRRVHSPHLPPAPNRDAPALRHGTRQLRPTVPDRCRPAPQAAPGSADRSRFRPPRCTPSQLPGRSRPSPRRARSPRCSTRAEVRSGGPRAARSMHQRRRGAAPPGWPCPKSRAPCRDDRPSRRAVRHRFAWRHIRPPDRRGSSTRQDRAGRRASSSSTSFPEHQHHDHQRTAERKDRIPARERDAEEMPGRDVTAYERRVHDRLKRVAAAEMGGALGDPFPPFILDPGMKGADRATDRNRQRGEPDQCVAERLGRERQRGQRDGGVVWPALPHAHLAREQPADILAVERTGHQAERKQQGEHLRGTTGGHGVLSFSAGCRPWAQRPRPSARARRCGRWSPARNEAGSPRRPSS